MYTTSKWVHPWRNHQKYLKINNLKMLHWNMPYNKHIKFIYIHKCTVCDSLLSYINLCEYSSHAEMSSWTSHPHKRIKYWIKWPIIGDILFNTETNILAQNGLGPTLANCGIGVPGSSFIKRSVLHVHKFRLCLLWSCISCSEWLQEMVRVVIMIYCSQFYLFHI